MKNAFLLFLLSVSVQLGYSQNKQLWKGYFSYNNIKDLAQSENRLYAASENAVFWRNTQTNEVKTISTVDGLSSQIISAIYHSPAFNKTLVGYENGLLTVINDTDGAILNVVDIINKQLPPNIKKINHFMEYNNIVYISCDFGIVQYDLSKLQFGDTYYIGTTTSEIVVNQTAVHNGYIYASTLEEGVKRALVTNPNLIDPSQWSVAVSGSFSGVNSFANNIFATGSTGQVLRSTDGVSFTAFGPTLSPPAIDLRSSGDNLLITTPNTIYIYNSQLLPAGEISNSQIPEMNVLFTTAATIGGKLYIGTTTKGVLSSLLSNPIAFEPISPSGPFRNNMFSITATESNLWAAYGGYDEFFIPFGNSYGFNKFSEDTGWIEIPFSQADESHDLVRITANPKNENQIFVSSYEGGILKYENESLVAHYDYTNSGLETFVDPKCPTCKGARMEQSAFDRAGNLWMTNGLIDNAIKVLKTDGTWGSYSVKSIVADPFIARFSRIAIDKNGTKWISSLHDGLIGFNESKGGLLKKITTGDAGNLPVAAVQVAAVDNRNQVWIGTQSGLRVLPSADRFLSNQKLTATPIIILENGVAQELMYQQYITDIVVDGANNKWVSTLDSGVFLFSPNGQETIHHFTSSNSPLPSNSVNDMDINHVTGEVFFATQNGLVSFKGTGIKASENLDNVVVYPNPVRPEYQGTVKITGLLDKANVKITDIEGNLVHEVVAEGGLVEWDTSAFGRYKVQSGVYMIFISAQDGVETKVKKVMVVR